MTTRAEQEAWEDAELLPDMTEDARRWFLAERERRKDHDRLKRNQDANDCMEG